MGKYYISNGDEFLRLQENSLTYTKGTSAGANRFKYSEAINVLATYFKDKTEYSYQKLFDSKSGKRYVITNATSFVGKNDSIVKRFEDAKVFKSAADAENYIKSHSKIKKIFITPIIWDDKFSTVDMSAHKEFTAEQLSLFNKGDLLKSKRIHFRNSIKNEVYERSGGKCGICGKDVLYDDCTIDHIIPLSRGGTNDISNLRCACSSCNKLKDNLMDQELKKSMTDIVINELYSDPVSGFSKQIIRSIVRGTIEQYRNITDVK